MTEFWFVCFFLDWKQPVYVYMFTDPGSPVQKIDGVTPVVLNMPAEGREAHAHIEPGHLHT